MVILSLNYEYPPLGGGSGVVTCQLNKYFAEAGHDVYTVTSWLPGLKRIQTVGRHTVIRLFTFRKNTGFSTTFEKIGYIIFTIFKIGKIIRLLRPDIVHCHFAVPTGFVAYYIKKLFNIPYVITSHGGDVPGFSPDETDRYFRFLNRFFRIIWQNANCVVTVSGGLSKMIKEAYQIHPLVIPNGINIDDYLISGKVNIKQIRLLFAGRFAYQKNLGFLIQSMELVREDNWVLYLIGDGPQKNAIQYEIEKLGFSEKIFVLSWKDKNDLKKYLKDSDILCLTSVNEGLPIIGLEGLASGLAIVGNDTTGIEDIVEDGVNGFLVEPNNQEKYAECISSLLGNIDLLESMKAASLDIAKKFNWEIVAKDYQKVLVSYSS